MSTKVRKNNKDIPMNNKLLNSLYQKAIRKINENDFKGALHLVRNIQDLGSNYMVYLISGQILIEAGIGLEDEQMTRGGIDLLQTHLKTIEAIPLPIKDDWASHMEQIRPVEDRST